MSETNRRAGDDPVLARRYAAGELDEAEAAAFERRLAADQATRDALCAAVCEMRAAEGRSEPKPDPAYRTRVRSRLREVAARRQAEGRGRYRIHPAAWAVAGAAAAALLLVSVRTATGPSGEPAAPRPAASQEAAAPLPGPEVAADDGDDGPDLLSGQHLARTIEEENRRKDRRIVRLEDRAVRSHAPVYRQ
jgi:anti-sigma-K factor RskA